MRTDHPFPGSAVRAGDPRRETVRLVQQRLEALGCGPLATNGVFGAESRGAVQQFQARRGLVVDGVVGGATWIEAFGAAAPSAAGAASTPAADSAASASRFAAELLKIAAGEIGVREAGGPNRGPRVDEYLRGVGLDPTRGSYAWCASFVYFCFTRAAATLGVRNPCVKTAGCMAHWRRAPERTRIPIAEVQAAPQVLHPGAIFIVDHGEGKGHTGLVERVSPGSIHTIEGNTNAGGSREGDGVYRRIRPLAKINAGFIDYALDNAWIAGPAGVQAHQGGPRG